MMSEFHFIRPLWLLAALALLAIWWIGARATRSSLWEHYIPKNMIKALRVNQTGSSSAWRWTLLFAWLVLTLAMAGPTWHKTPLPTLTNQQALVLALDLSPSMTAKDLPPSRLARAQYKMIDILRLRSDSQVALIAYAGDAHIVSPLTDDPATIEALLSALSPSMMPSQGNNTEAAISLAMQLLDQSNVVSGEILLITDGITTDAQANLIAQSNGQHTISILAVGSREGAPIPAARGGFLKSTDGDIVLASVNHEELANLAGQLGGKYTALQNDESDIQYLLTASPDFNGDQIESGSVVYDSWVDMGHWLVLLILPFAAYCFRKGLIFIVPFIAPILVSLLLFQPIDSQAAWYDQLSLQDLWKKRNQQATELMQEQQFEQAAAKFNDPDWAATAQYRAGQYEQATENFSQQDSLRNLYNTGNSLALQGDLENAIEAYQQVLDKDPEHEDAAHNKSIVEQMLAQNQKQSDQQQSQDSGEQSEQQDGQASDQQQEPQQPQQSESGQDDEQSDQQQAQQDGEQGGQGEQQAQTEEQDSEQQSEQEQQSSDDAGQQDEEQAAAEQQQQEQTESEQGEQQDESLSGQVRDEQEPLQDASEQWLRTIQDDPSGLLKRKFEYQAWRRSQQEQRSRQGRRSSQPSTKQQQRY